MGEVCTRKPNQNSRTARNPALAWALLLLASGLAYGQGIDPYVNFESPQGHPIEVFHVNGFDVIAVCNTPNNSIEFYTPDETESDRLLGEIKVGLEPVSVRYNANNGFLYSANFLGDSVSIVHISMRNGVFGVIMVKTVVIGDEVIDLAFRTHDFGTSVRETILTTHMSPDAFRWLDAWTLDPVIAGANFHEAAISVDTVGNGDPNDFISRAAKEPRAIRVLGDQLFILPLKGGENDASHIVPDMDLYCDDLDNLFANPVSVEGLGTTGFNMDFGSDGVLYIVGGEALNKTLTHEANVAAAQTGFFKSMFYRVENPCSGNPLIQRRDVNLEPGLQQVPGPEIQGDPDPFPETRPVSQANALSMLTDVVVYEDGGTVPKVFFTALSNDRIGVIQPNPAEPDENKWQITRINIPPINGNALSGPNGLALKRANSAIPNDPGDRIYVLNHFDSSITTIDPATLTKVAGGDISLAHDPRPKHLNNGRRFLYDSKLSGNHFVSCASCHIYGRTDGLPWDLGDPNAAPIAIPTHLPDAVADTEWEGDKGPLITQTLQGLLNSELDPLDQDFTTNAPYHWRGDRETFLDFRPAFESLLKGPELGLDEMIAFETFVNTIHYPPNPRQPRDRVLSGDFGVGEDLSTDQSTLASRGLKFFHIKATVGGRSCAMCHALPEGSNNRLTDSGPLETAAIRGLYQRESKREESGYSDLFGASYTGFEGLVHNGKRGNTPPHLVNHTASINGFNFHFFSGTLCGQQHTVCDDLQDLNQFGHEIDWGMGPLVGCSMTIDFANAPEAYPGSPSQGCDLACSDTASTLDCMEEQAGQANSGVAVQGWDSGVISGYWFDPVTGLYVEESSGQTFTRTDLIDTIAGRDRFLFQAVPLGSERRVASPSGVPAGPISGGAPSTANFLPMTTNSFFDRVPEMQGIMSTFDNNQLEGIFIHTLRLYQWGLILDSPPGENGFGVGAELHHDAPRRFQVSANNIRHGASLVLAMQDDPNGGPPNPNLGTDQFNVREIVLPLYATDRTDPSSLLPIWQTAVELDPLKYYSMMLGGPNAPGVTAAFFDPPPFQFPMSDPTLDRPVDDSFDPDAWNWIHARIVNADGTTEAGDWYRLRVD